MNIKTNISFDFLIIISILFLVIFGIFFIYSSNIASDGTMVSNEYIKQIIWVVLGFAIMSFIITIDYKTFENFSIHIYCVSIIFLIVTLLIGNKINGAKRWLGIMDFVIQPSEFAKISTIIMLSAYYAKQARNIRRIFTLCVGALIMLLPAGLIMLQPDMGTALVYIPIFLFISFLAGADVKHIGYLVATGLLTVIFIIMPIWFQYIYKGSASVVNFFTDPKMYNWIFISSSAIVVLSALGYFFTKKIYYYFLMYSSTILSTSIFISLLAQKIFKPYQIMRLVVFIDPNIDPRGAGWHTIQSITAVGSGGLLGKGFLKGTQSHLRYLPQQSTDFIFSIISEETGFLGCIAVFLFFSIIIARGFFISGLVKDSFGSNIAAGVAGMIFFHFAVNIGMAIGVLPITGIPLFFLSYGGSSLWTAMIGCALIVSIYFRRYNYRY